MSHASIDPDLLRTFVFIAEEGSFTRAGRRAGRTQSAISMQLQRLEALLGHTLVARGRGGAVQLTANGQFLLERARELLALNDRIWENFHSPVVAGTVRLGTPDDYALRYLPTILKRFAEQHPSVQVDVLCLPSSNLVERLRERELDLTLCSEGNHLSGQLEGQGFSSVPLWRGRLSWITSTRYAPHKQSPVPLAVAADHCNWRHAAMSALDGANIPYRVAYRSATQIGTQAPVLAGLAVTVATTSWVPEGLRAMRPDEGLPPLPEFGIMLLKSPDATQPVTDALARYITETFRAEAEPDVLAA